MHRGLQRQLKRTLGLSDPQELATLLEKAVTCAALPALDPAVADLLKNFGALVERINVSYEQADRDLELRTRSLELSSAELNAANTKLRGDLEVRSRAIESLRSTLTSLVGEEHVGDEGSDDELESLSRIIANLVHEREEQRNRLDSLKFALDQHAIVSITDTAGTILYANERFCEISGFTRQELIGNNHRIVKSGRHPLSFYEEMWLVISAGYVWNGEICNRKKSGEEYWVAATIVPFLDDKGLPYEYIAIRTDITARKLVENELIQARDAAEAANRAKSDFLANMSHEIRTPMNGIIGMTDLMLDTRVDEEQREYLAIVKSSAESLLTIINDILDFSKIEAGKLSIERIGFDLRGAIDETLKPMVVRARQKGLALRCDIAAEVPGRLVGDPGRIRQILINLIGNAIKFTERGEIAIAVSVETLTTTSAVIQIAVRDTGIGIPPEKQAHIFEAFTQEDSSTTRKYGGTGLGLTISNRLVELMGGSLEVTSSVGAGSTFSFSLVLGIDQGTSDTTVRPAEPGQLGSVARQRVLLVEDNVVNQQLATRLLEKRGHVVKLARHGQEALDMLAAESFDLVLMDMQMPVMGGIEATQLIRQRETTDGGSRVRIIAMTANAMQGDRETCLAAGMDDYLAKPIKAVELVQKVEGIATGQVEPRQDTESLAMESSAFDYAAALAGMDREIVEIIAPAFLEHYGSELAALRQAIAAGEAAVAARHAHGLKGTLAAFGAQPAERRAAEIEALAKAADLGQVPMLQADLEKQVAELAKALTAAGFAAT